MWSNLILLLGICCGTSIVNALSTEKSVAVKVPIGKLFMIRIAPGDYGFSAEDRSDDFAYTITSEGSLDVPWVESDYNKTDKSLMVFGTMPEMSENTRMVRVRIMSERSYKIAFVNLLFTPDLQEKRSGQNVLRLRIVNKNLMDMYVDSSTIKTLLGIFNELWAANEGEVYTTYIRPARIVNPKKFTKPEEYLDVDIYNGGVIIELGSKLPLSEKMVNLAKEINTSYKKLCPQYNRRTSVELLFRGKGFIVDWCYFKFIELSEDFVTKEPPIKITTITDVHTMNSSVKVLPLKKSNRFRTDSVDIILYVLYALAMVSFGLAFFIMRNSCNGISPLPSKIKYSFGMLEDFDYLKGQATHV